MSIFSRVGKGLIRRKDQPNSIDRKVRHIAADPVLGEIGAGIVARSSVIVVAVSVLAFLLWASGAELDETANTTGEIIAEGKVHVVQHLEGGIVSKLLVSEGEFVEAGQPIARFDSEAATADLRQMRERRAFLSLKSARLKAFAAGSQPVFGDVDAPFRALMHEQKEIHRSQVSALNNRVAVIERRISERNSELKALKFQLFNMNQEIALHREALKMRRNLYEKRLNSRLLVINVERDLARSVGEGNRLKGQISSIEESIAGLRQRSKETRSTARERALRELEEVQTKLAEVENLISASFDRVERLVVRAPASGVVQNLPSKTERAVVAPGGVVAEIVPGGNTLFAETRIATRDVGHVEVGQPVDIKVQTFDYSLFGAVPGILERISATTFVDEAGQPYYQGYIRLARNYVERVGREYRLIPGMSVQADIRTGRKTVLQYLLKPIYTVRDEAMRER